MVCYRCYKEMVKVTIVSLWGREYDALVCTSCGRIYSKHGIFKGGKRR